MESVTKAKAQLILSQPFFATILLGQNIVEDNNQPTMATDGKTIYINRQFVESLTHAEITFVLAHEVMHCVFEHMHRRGSRDPMKWNHAADYIINDLLVNEGIGQMPKIGLLDADLVRRGGGTADGVYEAMGPDAPQPKQKKSGKGKGQGQPTQGNGFPQPGEPGGALDNLIDSAPDEATRNQNAAEMKIKVIQAKNAAKMAGKLSAGLERVIDDCTKSKVDWRAVLRRFLSEKSKSHYSYAKPKRRFLADDLCLPSLDGQKMGVIAIGVDCSGSIDDKMLALFNGEINGILEDTGADEIQVIYFDSEVLRIQNHKPSEMGPLVLTPIGGGGTAFSPIWQAIAKLEVEPVACVILTDLICSDFGDAQAYPILWASTDDDKAPFGEVIKIERD